MVSWTLLHGRQRPALHVSRKTRQDPRRAHAGCVPDTSPGVVLDAKRSHTSVPFSPSAFPSQRCLSRLRLVTDESFSCHVSGLQTSHVQDGLHGRTRGSLFTAEGERSTGIKTLFKNPDVAPFFCTATYLFFFWMPCESVMTRTR